MYEHVHSLKRNKKYRRYFKIYSPGLSSKNVEKNLLFYLLIFYLFDGSDVDIIFFC